MPKKEGVFPKHPRVRRIAPSPKEALERWPGLQGLVVAITTKRFWCEGPKKKDCALREPFLR